MKKYMFILFLLLASFIANRGHALCDCEPIPGLYFGILGGWSGGFEVKNKIGIAKCRGIRTGEGYYVGGKLGKNIYSFLRFEGEFLWRDYGLHDLHFSKGRQNANTETNRKNHRRRDHRISGYTHLWSFMTNVIYDSHFNFPITPFVGGGLGYAETRGQLKKLLKKNKILETFHQGGFAWQAIVGLKYVICSDFLEVDLEYRFLDVASKIKNHNVGLTLTTFF